MQHPLLSVAQTGSKSFFISYDDSDKKWAEWITWHLEAAGYAVEKGPVPGNVIVIAQDQAFNNSNHVMVVLSSDYLKVWKQHPEVAAALQQNPSGEQRKLLPILVRDCKSELEGVLRLKLIEPISLIDIVDEQIALRRLLAGAEGKRDQPDGPPKYPMSDGQSGGPLYPGGTTFRASAQEEHTIADESEDAITDTTYIQQRKDTVKNIYDQLVPQSNITALALVGMSGIGKSTLTRLVYNYAEAQRDTNGKLPGKTLRIKIEQTDTFITLAEGILKKLGKSIPLFKELPPQRQAYALTNALNTAQEPRLIILDQFENLLDEKTGQALSSQPGVDEWLNALNELACACRVLFTSNILPQRAQKYLKVYQVKGLETAEGMALLRNLGVVGTVEELQAAVRLCGGHTYALELLAPLVSEYHANLSLFLNDPAYTQLLHRDIAEIILGQIYERRLNEEQRLLLRCLAIYREPIPIEAALALEKEATKVRLLENLRVPLMHHLVEAGHGQYQLHPIVSTYVHNHFVGNDEDANKRALVEAHKKASQYYLRQTAACPARDKREKLGDIHPLIEAIWHQLQANLWRDVFNLMRRENILSNLKDWGEYGVLLDLCKMLLPVTKWNAQSWEEAFLTKTLGEVYDGLFKKQEAQKSYARTLYLYKVVLRNEKEAAKIQVYRGQALYALGDLEHAQRCYESALMTFDAVGEKRLGAKTRLLVGDLYDEMGQVGKAQEYFRTAHDLFRQVGNQEGIVEALNRLGDLCVKQGDSNEAMERFLEAIRLAGAVGDKRKKALTLNKLGTLYCDQSKTRQALECYLEAYQLYRDLEDHRGEAESLNGLVDVSLQQGNLDEASSRCEEALRLYRLIGDRHGEAISLNLVGRVLDSKGLHREAILHYDQPLAIFREIKDRRIEGWVLYNIGSAYKNQADLVRAQDYYNQALMIHQQLKDRKAEGITLTSLGQLCHRQDQKSEAMIYFQQAVPIHKEIKNRMMEGVTLQDAGAIYADLKDDTRGLACLLRARDIFEEIQSPRFHKDKTRQSIEVICTKLGEQAYRKLLIEVEPQAQLIVNNAFLTA